MWYELSPLAVTFRVATVSSPYAKVTGMRAHVSEQNGVLRAQKSVPIPNMGSFGPTHALHRKLANQTSVCILTALTLVVKLEPFISPVFGR